MKLLRHVLLLIHNLHGVYSCVRWSYELLHDKIQCSNVLLW